MSDDRKPTDGGDDELYESPDGPTVQRVPKDADGNATREYDFQEVESLTCLRLRKSIGIIH
jgi:hypothetical protein